MTQFLYDSLDDFETPFERLHSEPGARRHYDERSKLLATMAFIVGSYARRTSSKM